MDSDQIMYSYFYPIKQQQPIIDYLSPLIIDVKEEEDSIEITPKITLKNVGNKRATDLKINLSISLIDLMTLWPDKEKHYNKEFELGELLPGEEKNYSFGPEKIEYDGMDIYAIDDAIIHGLDVVDIDMKLKTKVNEK